MTWKITSRYGDGSIGIELSDGKRTTIYVSNGVFTIGSGAMGGKYRSLEEAAEAFCRS